MVEKAPPNIRKRDLAQASADNLRANLAKRKTGHKQTNNAQKPQKDDRK